jgi:adenine-specific DNA methylase
LYPPPNRSTHQTNFTQIPFETQIPESISSSAYYVTLQKYFSHPSLVINKVMSKKVVTNPNFKGFMASITQVNWNVLRIMYMVVGIPTNP